MTKEQYDSYYKQCLMIIQFFRRNEPSWIEGVSFRKDLQAARRYDNARFVLILLQRNKNSGTILEQIAYDSDSKISKTGFQVGQIEYLPFSVEELKFLDLNGIIINGDMSRMLNQYAEDWIYDE